MSQTLLEVGICTAGSAVQRRAAEKMKRGFNLFIFKKTGLKYE